MQKAKAAVNNFVSKSGHHDTTVHESVAPAVQKETIKEHHTEEQQIARDREVHQDHHHTSVQPVKDREVLPEQHHHQMAATEHRTHDHRDYAGTKERLQHEAGQFKNESVRAPAHQTHTTHAPEVAGEHVHHHVHETIQPVVHKETVEPHVVHTTIPVHETHHNPAQHHTASHLPPVDMGTFQKQSGALTGRGATTDHFTGEPRTVNKHSGSAVPNTGAGQHSGMVNESVHHNPDSAHHDQHSTGNVGTGIGTHKPSLMDKLNPKKDANGDGKAGFMS